MAIADPDHCLDCCVGDEARDPVHVADFADGTAEFLIFADYEAILGAVERDYVHWGLAAGEAEALALTDRELMQTCVAA